MQRLPIHYQLFIAGHSDKGKPHVHRGALEVALAGALLVDLAFRGATALAGPRLVTRNPHDTGDPVANNALRTIMAAGSGHDPRHWIERFAVSSYDTIADSLVTWGIVRRQVQRRLGLTPATRYPALGPDLNGKIRAQVRYAVTSGEYLPSVAAFWSFLRTLHLEARMHLNNPPELRVALDRMAQQQDPGISDLIAATEHVLAARATAIYG
ncbi:MAG: GOLPH3/VPS74 family protein [Micromonosporaceae bacterium]